MGTNFIPQSPQVQNNSPGIQMMPGNTQSSVQPGNNLNMPLQVDLFEKIFDSHHN